MTNQGPRKGVDAVHSSARLLQAREFHESARSLVTLGQGKSYNGAITLMVTAVMAYGDAMTAKARGVVNKQDHQSAPKLLREVRARAIRPGERHRPAGTGRLGTHANLVEVFSCGRACAGAGVAHCAGAGRRRQPTRAAAR